MSFLDNLKAIFSGGSGTNEHDDAHEPYLQSPTEPDHIAQPTAEELAAAAQAEPPTTTVAGLGDGEPHDEERHIG